MLPALKRHLSIVHKVKDLARYQEESGVDVAELEASARLNCSLNDSFASSTCSDSSFDTSFVNGATLQVVRTPPIAKRKPTPSRVAKPTADDGNPLNTLQCNVCYKSFDETSKLRKHMRAHGMAFISSKRAQSARH